MAEGECYFDSRYYEGQRCICSYISFRVSEVIIAGWTNLVYSTNIHENILTVYTRTV